MFKKLMLIAVLVLAMGAGAFLVPVSANHEDQGLEQHCPDHNGHPGKVNNPAFPSTTTKDVDGTEVNVNVGADKKSVSFTDENGDPIVVDFCIKAGNLAGGKQTGSSGEVTWTVGEKHNTPDISYVVVYASLVI